MAEMYFRLCLAEGPRGRTLTCIDAFVFVVRVLSHAHSPRMSRFIPPRASSPPNPSKRSLAALSDVLDASISSTPSLSPELAALTPDEVDFIDAVVQRASPAATTLTIFKVYSELLKERGVDPDQETVLYNKLLKVLTVKGKNWGEKWDIVKRQLRPQPGPSRLRTATAPPPRPAPPSAPAAPRAQILTRLTGALKAIERDEDAFTLHSHQDDVTDATQSEALTETETDADRTYRPHAIRRLVSPTLTMTTNSLGLSIVPPPASSSVRTSVPIYKATLRRPFTTRAPAAWDAETSEATADTARASSSIPPSYGAATREIDTPTQSSSSYTPLRALAKAHSKAADLAPAPLASHPVPAAARAAVLQARGQSGSAINEDEAWKKIRMERDEEEADRFREDRLLERCWEVWMEGYRWIVVCTLTPSLYPTPTPVLFCAP